MNKVADKRRMHRASARQLLFHRLMRGEINLLIKVIKQNKIFFVCLLDTCISFDVIIFLNVFVEFYSLFFLVLNLKRD